jgi:hypothetical protein
MQRSSDCLSQDFAKLSTQKPACYRGKFVFCGDFMGEGSGDEVELAGAEPDSCPVVGKLS